MKNERKLILKNLLAKLYDDANIGSAQCLTLISEARIEFPEIEDYADYHYIKAFCLANYYSMAEEALIGYNKAIEMDDDQPVYYFDRYEAYKQLGNLEGSEKDKLKIIELDPGYNYFPPPPEVAINTLTSKIQKNPDDPWLYVERAKLYREIKDYDNGLNDATRAMTLFKNQKEKQ